MRQELPLSSTVATIAEHPTKGRRGLVVAIGVALIFRLTACWFWMDELTIDRDAYLGIARNITAGQGFCSPESHTPTAFRPPVFPILIGIVRFGLPEAVAVAVINIAAGLATVWAAWLLVELWWQPALWKKVAAATAVAVDPLLLRYSAQPMTECVFTALTVWTLVGVTRLWFDPRAPWQVALFTGIVAGLAALCRPTLYPLIGLMLLCLLFVAPRLSFKEYRYRQAAIYALAASAIIALWAGRNLVVLDEPLLTTTHGGYTLLLGNNPVFYEEVARKPWGTVWGYDSLVRWQASIATDLQDDLGDHVNEVAADRWHSQRAWKAIQADPVGFRAAVAYRVRSFWSLAPRGPEASNRGLSTMVAGWYATLFMLAAMGFFNAVRQHSAAAWIGGLLIATVAALHLLYWTDTRMRAPLHPVLVAFAAGAGAVKRMRP